MKKYFLLAGLFALLCAFIPTESINAQWAVPKALTTTAYGNALDTVDNTETHVTTTSEGRVATWKTGVTASVVVTKISGTVGGTIVLQGSLDGTNWVTVDTTGTITDATANYGFNTTERWYYYRVNYTGTGTMSASMKCHLFAY